MLSPPFHPSADWAKRITNSLIRPAFPISLGEAFGRRYRRNYMFLFVILAASWFLKVAIHPEPATSLEDILTRAGTGPVSGLVMIIIGVLFNGALLLIGLWTTRLQESTAEVLVAAQGTGWLRNIASRARSLGWEMFEIDFPSLARFTSGHEAKQLAYVITDQEEAVSRAVIDELDRGITRLQGKGMYTGEPHGVLLCAFQADQADRLRAIIRRVDPKAFVIITGVQDIRGGAFRPLEA